MNQYLNNSIFWIEVEKIVPNPYQPRRDFDPNALNDLADSIRQYGILQPLVVTRKEEEKEDGGLRVSYELIAGERRLRASKIASISQVPVVIRSAPEDPKEKLEIAIIENLQREDLNPIDRARAFARLADEFGFKHVQIAKKVGRSREYVSNTLRLLDLPEEVLNAVREKKISEGHGRTLMMLTDRKDEQRVLFKEILYKKLSVREAESIARSIAKDRVRKKDLIPDPELSELEGKLSNTLGTRVHIERKENGGKLVIDFFSNNDLEDILALVNSNKPRGAHALLNRFILKKEKPDEVAEQQSEQTPAESIKSFPDAFDTNVEPETLNEDPEEREDDRGEDEEPKPSFSNELHQEPLSSEEMNEEARAGEETNENTRQDAPETPNESEQSAPDNYDSQTEEEGEENTEDVNQTEEERFEPNVEKKDEKTDEDMYSVKNFTI